jgi:exodeoxyribonuclease VII small subunit
MSMAVPEPEPDVAVDELTFEAALERLEATVARLEAGTLTIDDLVAEFEQGMRLVRACRGKLCAAQTRVEVLLREEATTLGLDPDALVTDEAN